LETTKYNIRVEWGEGLVNIGKEEIYLLMPSNISPHSSLHSKDLAHFNSLNSVFDFLASLGRSLERMTSLPFQRYNSFKQL